MSVEGAEVVLCHRNKPVVSLTPITEPESQSLALGCAEGEFKVPDDINEALPDEVLEQFS